MQNIEQLAQLVAQLLVVTEQLQKRAVQLDQRVVQMEQVLTGASNNIQQNMNGLSAGLERHIGSTTQKTVLEAVKQPTQEFERDIKQVTNDLHRVVAEIKKSQEYNAKWIKGLVWKSLAALTAAAFLLVGGTGFIVWKNSQEIKRQEFSMEIINATKAGALSICDGVLCAKSDKQAKRYGAKGEFVQIDK